MVICVSDASSIDSILGQAREREKEYDWRGAAEFCEKALNVTSRTDFLKLGQFQERIGYAFYRAGMQSEIVTEFRDRMSQSVTMYEKAKESYQKMNESGKTPRMLRCDAMIAQLGYWLAAEASEKKRLIDGCWRLAKESLEAFEQVDDTLEYGKTFNQLSVSVDLGFSFEWLQARKIMIEEALERGELAIRFLSTTGDSFELAAAYMKTATFLELFSYFADMDKREKHIQKANDYVQNARELSEEAFMTYMSSLLFGLGPGGFWGDGTATAISNLEKALEYLGRTKDRFIIGCTLDLLKYHTQWLSTTYDDRDEMLKHLEKALQYLEDAKNQFKPISFISPRGGGLWLEGPYTQYYWWVATGETDLSRRRELLQKALQAAPEGLVRAENSGYLDIICHQHSMTNAALRELAKITADPDEKRGLLEKALMHMVESCRISEQIEPPSSWNVNLMRVDRALTRSDLADLAKDHENRKNMLQESINDLETSLNFCLRPAIDSEKQGSVALFSNVAPIQSRLGDLWVRLRQVSQNNEHLQRAIEAFNDAAESYEKIGREGRVAECFWKVARIYDDLGDHLEAAESFNFALKSYQGAGEKIPQLRDFYIDKALYMQAWTEIEKARHHHERQEYDLAQAHFEKAADLHKSMKQLGYLASNYSAWSNVEHAEDLSRKEHCEEAIRVFEQAVKLFDETKKSLKDELGKIEDPDEKQMAINILKATDARCEYCSARVKIEEAKILDRKGDHYSSSQKYGSAAQTFEKITEALTSEQEKKEFRLVATLSQAWRKMTQAEAEQSPDLYIEASKLFDAAKELGTNEKTKMLALGHSRFCRALEVGTRFADSRDVKLHAAMTEHLESASNYYVKAGFKNASEYARATDLLFDAYLYMDNARKEANPEKKARLFMMAEKVLQTSAGSFMKAEHPEKRDQVASLLENVREERELAISLTEMLHAPSIIAATTTFSTPQPTQEDAVGLERLQHADIQANILIRKREVKVRENIELEIELVNAGKGPALLNKITGIIPEGFELVEKPETCRVEDSYLNMKGKRLDPLKIEEVRLVLKPKIQGEFALKPKILYVDDDGKNKSHEPNPISIRVKELGIKGWIRGEG